MPTDSVVTPSRTTPRARARVFGEGWPIVAVLWGFAVLWVLGVSPLIWVMLAPGLVCALVLKGQIKAPPGLGAWLAFLALAVPSIVMVLASTRGLVWLFRMGMYATGGILFVYVYNIDDVRLPVDRLLNAAAAYWCTIAFMGLAAVVGPPVELTTPMQLLVPDALASEEFVSDLLQTRLSQVQDFLGYAVARPAGPFTYTNNWGSNLALMTPLFVLWSRRGGVRRRTVALVCIGLASVPAVLSLNRGLWLSLAVGLLYAAGRQAVRTEMRQLVGLAAGGVLVVTLVMATGLGDVVSQRAETGHSDNRRLTLYSASLDAIAEEPLVGNGGPVTVPNAPAATPPAGTHGQLWLVPVSHGVPAAVAFLGFFAVFLWRTRRAPAGSLAFAVHVTWVMAAVQLPVYELIPSQLPVLMVFAGAALRELRA